MPWAKIDDQFPDHPKIAAAGPMAGWLHVCGICYCSRMLTDGFIPSTQVRRLSDIEDVTPLVTVLVAAGLWEEAEGGYQVHDYLEYNPSAEEVKAQRTANAQRQAEWRERNKPKGSNAVTNAVTKGASNTRPVPHPVPTPVPVPKPQPEPLGETKKAQDKPARVREPDMLFEAVVEVCYQKPHGEITDSERNRVNRALPELRKVRATPADVFERAAEYRSRSPDFPLTPQTLTKSWTDLGKPRLVVNNARRNGALTPDQIRNGSSQPNFIEAQGRVTS